MMALSEFENLLQRKMGLNAVSIGSSAIERAVRQRLAVCKLQDPAEYLVRVRSSEAELQELIEAVVVPETWFFRDRGAFEALAHHAREELLRAPPVRQFRVLSLPCSTGEEPYSAAMALLEAGVPPGRFQIDAHDISRQSIAYAQRAIYGRNSFRGEDLGFRDRFFTQTASGYELAEAVRGKVRFQQGNIFDENLVPGGEIYDAIFCRNLLIYFDRETQDRVIRLLGRLLNLQGLLFVGPSETGILAVHDFISTRVPLAFAFRKNVAPKREPRPKPAAIKRSGRALVPPKVTRRAFSAMPSAVSARRTRLVPQPKSKASIEDALRLANQGKLKEAAEECEAFLRANGPSADAFYLLGLVRDASSTPGEAATFYRKALYLNPNHREALMHLAFLLERQGDKAGAMVLNGRLNRLEQRSKH